jgi:hypothetical protein
MGNWKRVGLLAFGSALTAWSALTLGGCNSGSASGSAQSISGTTKAQTASEAATPKTTRVSGPGGLIGAAVSKAQESGAVAPKP